jgi:hypothetical protein
VIESVLVSQSAFLLPSGKKRKLSKKRATLTKISATVTERGEERENPRGSCSYPSR